MEGKRGSFKKLRTQLGFFGQAGFRRLSGEFKRKPATFGDQPHLAGKGDLNQLNTDQFFRPSLQALMGASWMVQGYGDEL